MPPTSACHPAWHLEQLLPAKTYRSDRVFLWQPILKMPLCQAASGTDAVSQGAVLCHADVKQETVGILLRYNGLSTRLYLVYFGYLHTCIACVPAVCCVQDSLVLNNGLG
jgi:hypothetical protein